MPILAWENYDSSLDSSFYKGRAFILRRALGQDAVKRWAHGPLGGFEGEIKNSQSADKDEANENREPQRASQNRAVCPATASP